MGGQIYFGLARLGYSFFVGARSSELEGRSYLMSELSIHLRAFAGEDKVDGKMN